MASRGTEASGHDASLRCQSHLELARRFASRVRPARPLLLAESASGVSSKGLFFLWRGPDAFVPNPRLAPTTHSAVARTRAAARDVDAQPRACLVRRLAGAFQWV